MALTNGCFREKVKGETKNRGTGPDANWRNRVAVKLKKERRTRNKQRERVGIMGRIDNGHGVER